MRSDKGRAALSFGEAGMRGIRPFMELAKLLAERLAWVASGH